MTKCGFGNSLAELFAPFLACPRASSRNATLARQRYAQIARKFYSCDALVASERRLGPEHGTSTHLPELR
jgi:hypothetical protein